MTGRPESGASPAGRVRWTICALLFFATTVNYIDRQILGLLAPLLQKEIGWTELQYSYIVTAFQAAYALGLIVFGWAVDKFGTRLGYSASVVVWSLAAAAHALARTVFGFGAARAALGAAEAGNFPAAIKTVAEWFPKKERALATGLFNSGANFGAVIAPAVVPWLTVTFGWPAAFVATGALGFLWLVFWLVLYERPERKKRLSSGELAYILSDPPETATARIPWRALLRHRQTWAFVLGKFLTDPIWWFYLYWLPKFLNAKHGLTITSLGIPLIVIYTMTSIGSVGGGWLSSRLIRRGWTVNRSRKAAMLLCAVCVVPIVTVSRTADLWTAVLIIGLAAAAHQGWSANIFTIASDMFPKRAVGSIVGLGGMAGAAGGLLFSPLIGFVLERTHNNYLIPFLVSGSVYLLAFAIIQALAPRLEPADLDRPDIRPAPAPASRP
ncbi:MAG TPA: MFS transporter [Acidobacteriota bacterium]|nr:MFS transporter [Acidobacteriota bacterium]